MNVDRWTGMPLTRDMELDYSQNSDVTREQVQEETDRGPETEGEREGDGWEERLLKAEVAAAAAAKDRERDWGMGTIREAEEESEGESEVDGDGGGEGMEGGGGGGRVMSRREGGIWEEPEITAAAPNESEDDELAASNNTLDLSQENLSPKENETERDDQNLVYATISESHRAKKRMRMMNRMQKEELKARKEKRRLEEREEKERRKVASRERKIQEKERKREVKEKSKRMEIGLGNVIRLQDVDTSTKQGRAQAQFIDTATAAIF